MNNPVISIITICFNAERTIAQTVNSVLGQDYGNIEYIIVDGASTDSTMQVLAPYKDRITHLVSEPDNGLYDAFNKGIRLATGDIIGILNADDFYPDNKVLSNIVELFQKHPEAEAISTSVRIFKDNRFDVPFRTYFADKFRIWQFRLGMQPPHPGFFISRKALQKTGLYNENYKISGDFDWLLRVLRINRTKTFYTGFISVYMRDGGLSASGFASKKTMNSENLRSLRSNGIYSNLVLIYCKYFIKLFQVNIFSFFRKG